MLNVSVDSSAALDCLDHMIKQIDGFEQPMNNEFLTWQHVDMNRDHPVSRQTENMVETIILPRGKPGPGYRRIYRPRARASQPLVKRQSRPILRPELYIRLCNRMIALMRRELTWR